MRFIIPIIFSGLLIGCAGKSQLSDQEQIEANVRNYLFLPDSIALEAVITDTITTDQLEEMLTTVERNISLINQDLDTLSLMIDDMAYRKLDFEQTKEDRLFFQKGKYTDSLAWAEKAMLTYQLQQARLNLKRESFKQTKRILLSLKRNSNANVAAFNSVATYNQENVELELDLLLDADFRVVD